MLPLGRPLYLYMHTRMRATVLLYTVLHQHATPPLRCTVLYNARSLILTQFGLPFYKNKM
jgi:hypothetical protein